jgi:hypothetical protein
MLVDDTDHKTKMILDHDGGEFPVIIAIDPSEALVAYTRHDQVIVRKVKDFNR